MIKPTIDCPCDGAHLEQAFVYNARPDGETAFDLGDQSYRRAYDRCGLCQHWFGSHGLDLRTLYEGDYSATTYGDSAEATFDRIVSLPASESDNAGRANRVAAFAQERFGQEHVPTLLDVGSGLGVFPYAMHQRGWICTALDPDADAAERIRRRIGIPAISVDFMVGPFDELEAYDVVSLNKVIEHVEDPCSMLDRARDLLTARGFVYIEVPDAEVASHHGQDREEFFIEHHHVFSAASLMMTVHRSGLSVASMLRITEPSTKFTLACFAVRQ